MESTTQLCLMIAIGRGLRLVGLPASRLRHSRTWFSTDPNQTDLVFRKRRLRIDFTVKSEEYQPVVVNRDHTTIRSVSLEHGLAIGAAKSRSSSGAKLAERFRWRSNACVLEFARAHEVLKGDEKWRCK